MHMADPTRESSSVLRDLPVVLSPEEGSATAALPSSGERTTGKSLKTDELSRVGSAMFVSRSIPYPLSLGGGVVRGLDDASRVAGPREQVHHADVESVADVLPVERVQPLRDVRSGVVGLHDRLQV